MCSSSGSGQFQFVSIKLNRQSGYIKARRIRERQTAGDHVYRRCTTKSRRCELRLPSNEQRVGTRCIRNGSPRVMLPLARSRFQRTDVSIKAGRSSNRATVPSLISAAPATPNQRPPRLPRFERGLVLVPITSFTLKTIDPATFECSTPANQLRVGINVRPVESRSSSRLNGCCVRRQLVSHRSLHSIARASYRSGNGTSHS